jgi:hypothetical protein
VDQVERNFVFDHRIGVRRAVGVGESELEGGSVFRDLDLVLLPVLLFRVLCDREVCGSGVSVFGVVVVCVLFF